MQGARLGRFEVCNLRWDLGDSWSLVCGVTIRGNLKGLA